MALAVLIFSEGFWKDKLAGWQQLRLVDTDSLLFFVILLQKIFEHIFS
jgi:hypothetical protein